MDSSQQRAYSLYSRDLHKNKEGMTKFIAMYLVVIVFIVRCESEPEAQAFTSGVDALRYYADAV
ncbi:hypothetical protein V8C34DRAFT_300983 [Trichoderma compactum]